MIEAERFECRICWYLYDPEYGDEQAQLPAGISFSELPENWRCPRCEGAKQGFLPFPRD